MNENETKKVTKNLFRFLIVLKSKIFRPLEILKKNDISPMQLQILSLLNEKQSMTMTELANEVLISKQQLTPLVDKLIDSNTVERKNDSVDRRIIKINLTKNGSEVLETHNNEILELLSKKFGNLNKEDMEKMDSALNQIYEIIKKMD